MELFSADLIKKVRHRVECFSFFLRPQKCVATSQFHENKDREWWHRPHHTTTPMLHELYTFRKPAQRHQELSDLPILRSTLAEWPTLKRQGDLTLIKDGPTWHGAIRHKFIAIYSITTGIDLPKLLANNCLVIHFLVCIWVVIPIFDSYISGKSVGHQ